MSNLPHFFFFFLNDPATPEIYTLPLHDALPICVERSRRRPAGHAINPLSASVRSRGPCLPSCPRRAAPPKRRTGPGPLRSGAASGRGTSRWRSEEHTSELQSQSNLVCRLLLEKK